MHTRPSRAAFRLALLLAALAAPSLTCQSLVAPPAEVDFEKAFASTQAAMELAATQAAIGAILTARAASTPTSPAPGAHSPEIISVDFPTTIKADGAEDVVSVKFKVITRRAVSQTASWM